MQARKIFEHYKHVRHVSTQTRNHLTTQACQAHTYTNLQLKVEVCLNMIF